MQQQYNNQQPYQQQPQNQPFPPFQPSNALREKKNLFSLLVSCLFGGAALFELISMIGMCAAGGGAASPVISYLLIVIGCAGFALAPLTRIYAKFCFICSSVVTFLGLYAIAVLNNMNVGSLFIALGVCAAGILAWFSFVNNNLLLTLWFVPGAVVFLGMVISLISQKYFSRMSFAVVFYLFDMLFMLALTGGAVVLGLFLIEIRGEKADKFKFPNPAPRQRKPHVPPQQQYQQPQQQYQQPQPQPQQQYQQPQQQYQQPQQQYQPPQPQQQYQQPQQQYQPPQPQQQYQQPQDPGQPNA